MPRLRPARPDDDPSQQAAVTTPLEPAAPPGHGLAWMLREEACILLTAIGYFSRIPVPRRLTFTPARLGASGRYISVVGYVTGLAGATVLLLSLHVFPAPLALLLSMVSTLLLTGALHEDGLADCCDGFGGGWQRDDVLRIMKDSRIGAFGAVGLVCALAVKWQAGVALAAHGAWQLAGWIVVIHAASRAMAIAHVVSLPYLRSDGKAQAFSGTPRRVAGVALLTGLPGLFWQGWRMGLICLVAVSVVHWLYGRWLKRRLGGYTGDCLGFAQQLTEITLYLTVLGWLGAT